MSKDYLIHTEALTVGYNGKPLISDIEIGVNRGEIMTLIGPNGAGKSTILKSLTRQLALVGGTIYLNETSMSRMSEKELSRSLSLVLTQRIQPELMTCFDVVASGRYPYTGWLGLLSEHDKEVVRQSMQYVHAEDLAELDFNHISDGQRQRVLLARALCQEPEIIVLDEPTSFLDIRHKLELLSLLKRLTLEQGLTVVMSLHELDLAQKISDVVVCVHNNQIERCGSPEEVFTSEYIHQLYGVETGRYDAAFGSLEFSAIPGTPKVFVIGGGGAGIPVYRSLNRAGIPFAAGVLHENDLDYPVAAALGSQIITESGFEPVCEEKVQQALTLLQRCDKVLCPLHSFGTMNAGNRKLLEAAERLGTLTSLADMMEL
ncbi:MAG: ABC transporter ATP-binding protein [Butyricicoccus sp.]